MKVIDCEIKGISPLLMHRFPLIPLESAEKRPPEEQAEYAAYRDEQNGGHLFVPGANIQRCFVSAATYSKGKGRASLQKQVAACVFISPANVTLGKNDYAIDSRAVVVPATKGRVVRHRPRIDEWRLKFEIEYDEMLLKESEVRAVVDNAGRRVGLLDFRPEKKGSFGRFMVTLWKPQK